jgi:hypothetical protein
MTPDRFVRRMVSRENGQQEADRRLLLPMEERVL